MINFYKTLLSMDGTIGGLFLIVKGYFASILRRKAGAGDAAGQGRWIGGRSFEKSSHISVALPGKRAFFSTIQPDLSCTPQISIADESSIIYTG